MKRKLDDGRLERDTLETGYMERDIAGGGSQVPPLRQTWRDSLRSARCPRARRWPGRCLCAGSAWMAARG